jgi:hypothetical protein
MDQALLERMIWVTDGGKVMGTAAITEHETRWQFMPQRQWTSGSYRIVVDTRLEDPAGNNLRRPFEIDVFHPIQRRIEVATVELPFRVGSSP